MNKNTIVLMTGPLVTEQPGGIQTHVQNFIAAFSASNRIDFRFLPVTLGLFDREGWGAKARRYLGSLLPFARAVRAADVVHINSTFDNRSLVRDGLYALIARRFLGKPVVLQFHGGLPAQVRLFRSRLAVWTYEKVLSGVSRILILSRLQGNQFVALFPRLGYELVPNYIDCGEEVSRTIHPDAPMRFLFMGRLHEDKGIKEIVAAAHLLANKGLEFVVEFCGDGPMKDWLVQEISELVASRGQAYLRYSGLVTGDEKTGILMSADVMLLPSAHEGFPYALLEAFKFAMPMIATRVGAMPDVISHGRNGLLISARETNAVAVEMEFAIRNPSAVHAMGANARKQVEVEFSIEKLRMTFEALYAAAGAQ